MSDDERDWGKIAMGGALIFLVLWVGTAGFTNIPTFVWPFGPVDQPGVQTKSTIVFYNGTAANDGTIQLVSMEGVPMASGAIASGTGTTGTLLPGTYFRYIIGVTGAAAFVDTVTVEEIADVAQTYATLPAVQLYRNSTTYSTMLQAGGDAYPRANGDGQQTGKNFSLSAQSAEPFTVTLTEKMGYAQLLEAYRDPVSGVACEPILWLEVTSTNIWSGTSDMTVFDDATKTYFLMPLSVLFNDGKESAVNTALFSLTAPTAGDLAYTAYIVSYSDMTTLLNAETRVANAAGPFTVYSFAICSGHLVVT